MTKATTTPITTALSTEVEGSVGGAGERHTHGNRLTDNSHHHTNIYSSSGRDSNSVYRAWRKEMCGGTLVM